MKSIILKSLITIALLAVMVSAQSRIQNLRPKILQLLEANKYDHQSPYIQHTLLKEIELRIQRSSNGILDLRSTCLKRVPSGFKLDSAIHKILLGEVYCPDRRWRGSNIIEHFRNRHSFQTPGFFPSVGDSVEARWLVVPTFKNSSFTQLDENWLRAGERWVVERVDRNNNRCDLTTLMNRMMLPCSYLRRPTTPNDAKKALKAFAKAKPTLNDLADPAMLELLDEYLRYYLDHSAVHLFLVHAWELQDQARLDGLVQFFRMRPSKRPFTPGALDPLLPSADCELLPTSNSDSLPKVNASFFLSPQDLVTIKPYSGFVEPFLKAVGSLPVEVYTWNNNDAYKPSGEFTAETLDELYLNYNLAPNSHDQYPPCPYFLGGKEPAKQVCQVTIVYMINEDSSTPESRFYQGGRSEIDNQILATQKAIDLKVVVRKTLTEFGDRDYIDLNADGIWDIAKQYPNLHYVNINGNWFKVQL